jgi:hypothetical protein
MKARTRFGARPAADSRDQRLEIGQEVEVTWGSLSGVSGVLLAFCGPDRCLVEMGILERGVLVNLPRQAVRSRFGP